MALIKLHLDEFEEVDYELIAIHSTLEDYRMAFFINQKLPIMLSKCKEEIIVKAKNEEVLFSKFVFDDSSNDLLWTLIQNKNEIITKEKTKNRPESTSGAEGPGHSGPACGTSLQPYNQTYLRFD
jgi:hypothetical protein